MQILNTSLSFQEFLERSKGSIGSLVSQNTPIKALFIVDVALFQNNKCWGFESQKFIFF